MKSPTKFETVPISELASRQLEREAAEIRPVVLVVDDEEIIAETLAAILDQAGFMAMSRPSMLKALSNWRERFLLKC